MPKQGHHAHGDLGDKLDSRGRIMEPGGHSHEMPVGVRRQANGSKHPMKWVSLHHHSTFSYGDGYALPEAHVRRAAELNMGAIALTEHGNMSSHIKLEGVAEKQGIKPIFGLEVYGGEIDPERRTQKKNHLTILAKDSEGYQNLIGLCSKSYAEGFHYEPTVDGSMLYEQRSGLVVLSGCQGSLLFTSLMGGKLIPQEEASYKRAARVAAKFKRAFDGNYYIEVQAFPELEATCLANPQFERMARQLHIGLVATMDIHYTAPTEAEIQKILHNVRPGEKRTLEDMERMWGYDAPLCHVLTDRVLYRRLRRTGISHLGALEAIENSALIAGECNVKLPKLPEPEFPLPPGYTTSRDLWRDWLLDGWRFRGCHRLPKSQREDYKARLKKEMDLIESKGYENYFLMVSDAVKWAKDNGVPVGPARGSAAASLAAYLLRITEVNPMKFPNLVFERFIDESRQDMPDIDLDFDSETRWRLREYLVGKYGECYNIGTFTYYRAKNSLDDVARVHRVPKWEVDIVKNQLIERSSGDLRSSATIEDTIEQFPESKEVVEKYPELRRAMDLEGNVKSFSVHAAGLVLGQVRTVAPVLERKIKGKEVQVVAIDKWDAERQGLLKMDFLGLNTMSLISNALKYIGMELQDLYDLALDDPETLKRFQDNDVIGVFQFEGQAVRLVNGQIKPNNFDEVCDVTALARPGPLHNGAAEAYMGIKSQVVQPERWHPAVDRIVAHTKYQIIYQEQILRIVREIGDFDWTAAAYIRKIISKKLGDQEFNRQKDKFMEGARTIHERTDDPKMTEDVANKVWGSCITSGSYAFNFAHSCAYGMLSFWTMWLKVHHPHAFYAAALEAMGDNRRNTLIRDAIGHGIEINPPSLSQSGRSWQMLKVDDQPSIRMGFEQIPGIGEKMAERVMETREDMGGWKEDDWGQIMYVKGIGPKKLSKILEFIEHEDPFGVFDADRRIELARESLRELRLRKPTHRSIDVPYEKGLQVPVVWMGVVRERNLRDLYEVNARMGKTIDPNKVKDGDLSEFMLLVAEDQHDLLRLRVDRYKYPGMKEALWDIELNSDVVWVEGFKPHYRSAREIVVQRMVIINVDEDKHDEEME